MLDHELHGIEWKTSFIFIMELTFWKRKTIFWGPCFIRQLALVNLYTQPFRFEISVDQELGATEGRPWKKITTPGKKNYTLEKKVKHSTWTWLEGGWGRGRSASPQMHSQNMLRDSLAVHRIFGTRGPEHYTTTGPENHRTRGPQDQKTKQPEDHRARGA